MARKMTATKVYRGGRTVRERKYETDDVKVDSGGSYRSSKEESFREKKVLTFEFSLASKGGGTTDVHISIGREDFALLLDSMVRVDRRAAMVAMSAELAKQIEDCG